MAMTFPSDNISKNKPRVRFISKSWEMGKPKLANTPGAKLTKGDSDIQLYLPGNFQEGYGASWNNEDVVTALVDPTNKSAWESSIAEALQNSTKQLSGLANSARYDAGVTALPGKFLVFEQANAITLNFNFELIPRNERESIQIQGIVDTFKRKILPMYGGCVLHFPDVWDIQFFGIKGLGFPDTPNEYTGMALVAAVPTYIGGASTLTYSSKHPVGVGLQLSFQTVKQPYLDRQGK